MAGADSFFAVHGEVLQSHHAGHVILQEGAEVFLTGGFPFVDFFGEAVAQVQCLAALAACGYLPAILADVAGIGTCAGPLGRMHVTAARGGVVAYPGSLQRRIDADNVDRRAGI